MMKPELIVAGILLIGLLIGCSNTGNQPEWQSPRQAATVDPANTELVESKRLYEFYCAHCHGYVGDGQGALSEEKNLALGYKIVPRHDEQGHTWQHPDQILFETIKYGVDSPLTLYIMSSYDEQLTDDEIWRIIDYIKRFWTDEQRSHQEGLTTQFTENRPTWEQYHLDIYTEATEEPE